MLLVLLVLLPLFMGGAHLPVALCGSLLLIVVGCTRCRFPKPSTWGFFGWAMALLVAITGLQLIPMPLGLLSYMAPLSYELLQQTTSATTWRSISLDNAATSGEWVKLTGYACLVLTLRAKYRSSLRWQNRIWAAIAATGAVVVLTGIVHFVLGEPRTWGYFGPGLSPFPTSFVNPNHQAGFLGFSALLAFATALRLHGGQSLLALTCAIISVGGLLVSHSRGSLLAFALSIVFATLLIRRRNRSPQTHRPDDSHPGTKRYVLFAAGSLGFLTLAIYFFTPLLQTMSTLNDPDQTKKLGLWSEAGRALLPNAGPLGLGRGTFPLHFAIRGDLPLSQTYTHVENEFLQTVLDWGLLPGSATLVLLALGLRRILRHAPHSDAKIFAITSLFYIALQNLSDFSLHLPAVAVPALAVACLLEPRKAAKAVTGTKPDAGTSPAPRAPGLLLRALPMVVTTLLSALASWYALSLNVHRDEARLKQLLHDANRWPAAQSEIRLILDRHPANYYLPALAAGTALAYNDPRGALRWINRSMSIVDRYAPAHEIAATSLWSLGYRSQSKLEVGLALQSAPEHAQDISRRFIRRGGTWDELAKIGPLPERARQSIGRYLLQEKRLDQAEQVLSPLLAPSLDDTSAENLELLGRTALNRGIYKRSIDLCRASIRKDRKRHRPYLVCAKAYKRLGTLDKALSILEQGLGHTDADWALLRAQARLLSDAGSFHKALVIALRRLRSASHPSHVADAHWELGRIYKAQNDNTEAYRNFESARRLDPKRLKYHIALARLRAQRGDIAGMEAVLQNAEREIGPTPEFLDKAQALRARYVTTAKGQP